jgi:hypothetical protein
VARRRLSRPRGALRAAHRDEWSALVEPVRSDAASANTQTQAGGGCSTNLAVVAYPSQEAREQLLDVLAQAIDQIALALAYLGEAYELLDENSAERLEEELFRPVQLAYGRARRTHAEFADRHGLPGRAFQPRSPGAPSQGAKAVLDRALEAAGQADRAIGGLQDSMLPVEVGDAELRAGLSGVRELIDDLPARARELVRTLGR